MAARRGKTDRDVKHYSQDKPAFSFFRHLPAIASVGALAFLGGLAGCHRRSDDDSQLSSIPDWTTSDAIAVPGAIPTSISPPALDDLSPVPQSLAGIPTEKTRLMEFAKGDRHLIRLNFGGFDQDVEGVGTEFVDPSIRLTQAPEIPEIPEGFDADEDLSVDEDNVVGPSASDLGPVEVIPTPIARPEFKAEIIPTPQGIPEHMVSRKSPLEPVARIAADIDGAKAKEADQSASMKKLPATEALIDPTTEIGLVGTQEGPDDFRNWAKPDVALFVTGDQHGYIEPCGCTGLDKQKGGVARRFTFMKELRDMDWPLLPIDAGNQIRRIGQQASIKFSWSSEALKQMKYKSVGFGPGDMRLSVGDLIQASFAENPDDAMYVAGNIVLVDPSLLPSHKVVRQGEWTIGLTSILDPDALDAPVASDVTISPIKEAGPKSPRRNERRRCDLSRVDILWR